MIYKCNFPNCSYQTTIRTHIHYHHIIPKELGGSDKKGNRIFLCPTHHHKVYVPYAKQGIHAEKSEGSIEILGWLMSTDGKCLHYLDENKEECFFFINN